MVAGLVALAVVVAELKPWPVSAFAIAEARPVISVPFSTVTAISEAGTAEAVAVAEAAVVPSPDPLRLAVPKAFVVLTAGYPPSAETARSILEFARDHLAPYQRIRRLSLICR